MIWILAVSLGLNLILFVAWLKTLEESREWKACARIGTDSMLATTRVLREMNEASKLN